MRRILVVALLCSLPALAQAPTKMGPIAVKALNSVRYADQFTGTTVTLQISAACADLSGSNGTVVIPSTMGAGVIPTLPPGCIVQDMRGNTGNGGILWSRQLSGTEQYGFAFATQNLASDGQSSTAILGEVAPGVSGTNVVGVRGEVSSAASAAVFCINHGNGGTGGVGCQGDSDNLPNAVGIEGTTAVSGSTLAQPSIGVKALATGHATYNASIALTATNDNGDAAVFNLNAPAASAIDSQVVKVVSALNSNTTLSIVNTSVGGRRWDFKSTGASDSCTGVAGFFVLYNQTDNRCPFTIDPATTNNMLRLTATGAQVLGKTETNTLKVDTGVDGDGGGIKHKRGTAGCATAASAGATCTTTVSWTTAFADANYTVVCEGRGVSSGVPVIGAEVAASRLAASITITTVAVTATAAQFTAVDCIAFHD